MYKGRTAHLQYLKIFDSFACTVVMATYLYKCTWQTHTVIVGSYCFIECTVFPSGVNPYSFLK